MNSKTPVQSQSAQMAVWRGVLRFMMQALPAVHHYHQVARCSLGTSLLEMPSWHHSKRRFDEQVWFVEYVKNTHKCLWGGRMSAVRHSRGGWRDQSGCCADLHTEGASVKDVWGGGLEERRRAMGCWGITKIIANNTKHCCVVRHAWQQSWPLTAERNKQFIEWARIHIATVVRLKRWQLPMWRNAAIMSDTFPHLPMPPKSSFQDVSQEQKCQIPEQKTKINTVINVDVHSFVIGEIFQSFSLQGERELKIKWQPVPLSEG